ncbi:hypothetical protein E2C01_061487 [Portunus trituberculatus]|uniref:Uncharacterized protein n=1 Tax=Portunus trituberculatus TaxID=210409 RepID=A0A5B7H890_PORTR|nr:hypothetical protein [Portunus trituberculatus]
MPEELVYGEDLRLLGQFAALGPVDNSGLSTSISAGNSVSPAHSSLSTLLPPHPLSDVFLRTNATTGHLQPPYTGLYRMLHRSKKYVILEIKGRPCITSWDRVKADHLLSAQSTPQGHPHPPPAAPSLSSQPHLPPAAESLRLPHPREVVPLCLPLRIATAENPITSWSAPPLPRRLVGHEPSSAFPSPSSSPAGPPPPLLAPAVPSHSPSRPAPPPLPPAIQHPFPISSHSPSLPVNRLDVVTLC